MTLKKEIKNKEKNIDYLLSTTILIVSLCFLLTGISSYTKQNLIFFVQYEAIPFIPQGITMCFYGILGLILSISQIITLVLNIGEGYNEFNIEEGTVVIFRKNYPGENSTIKLKYNTKDIEKITHLIINITISYNEIRKMSVQT